MECFRPPEQLYQEQKKTMSEHQPTDRLVGFDPRPIFESAPGFRHGEGELIVGGESQQVLGRMVACFLRFRDDDGMYFRGIAVVAPPRLIWDYSDEEIHAMLVKGVEDIQGNPMSAATASKFLELVTVHRCAQLDIGEVVAAVETVGNRRVILVPQSSKYRDPTLRQEWALGRSGALLPEDIWVPHTVRLAAACCEAAKAEGSVVVFSAVEEALVKQDNIHMLNSVDLLYPVVLGYEGQADTTELLSKQVPCWVALAAAGHTQQALEELEQSGLSEAVKRQVTLQIANRAGDGTKALELLHEYLAELEQLPADTAARLGRMAWKFGDKEAARKFFEAAIDCLTDEMWLEVSLMTVTSIGAAHLVERCWTRLASTFQNSIVLQENRELRLMQICDASASPAQAATSRAGFEDFHTYVADALQARAKVNYAALVEHVRTRWGDKVPLASICVALHALGNQDLTAAIDFAVMAAEDASYEPQAVRTLLGALQRMFLLEIRPAEGLDAYKVPLLFIMRYLGRHPEEASLRARLALALSVESAGAVGLPVLASLAIDVAGLGAQLKEDVAQALEPAPEEELTAFLVLAYQWMGEQPVIELGVTRLPAEIVGGNARRLIVTLERLMQYGARNQDAPDDLKALQDWAYIVCLLHPYAPERSADLDALRLLAAKLSLQGQPQRARDVAEQMLILAGASAERQRLAWGNYADIYQRTRSPVDALIGVTCAALINAQLNAADLFQEAYTLVRVTRDLHLYDVAKGILPACKHLYEIQSLGDMGQQRLKGIEIALDVAQSTDLDDTGRMALLERARAHCETVMQGGDELLPSAAQFLQVAGTIEREGQELPQAAAALRAALNERFGPETAAFVRAISVAHPSAEEVVWLHNRLGVALNSEDTAADQLSVVVAAHRLLLLRTPEIPAEQAAVAIELLSDRALELAAPAQPLSLPWPRQFIQHLSEGGLGILMLAMDSDDEVVVVVAEHGSVRVVRPGSKERTFRNRLNAWSARYPYRYGLIERDEGNGEFYASMAEFELPMPNTDKVLVVAQPMLQQLAYNLVLVDGQFAGNSKAIGIAPSLTWLDGARARVTTGKRHAWISCSPESEAYGTLDMLFSRLAPLFDQYGFITDTSGRIPSDMKGASMAIATAHGQLTSEQQYIHRIADEQKLTDSPLALARALAGVELVILFVCSGGRIDQHPMANTTVSLPKMLLDRGCRAVIASPWPLAAVVPGNWLERFLEAWEAGDTVLDANFKANQYVQQRLGPEPGLGLAMVVYGDVLLTK